MADRSRLIISKINSLNNLIYFCCNLLNVRKPEIYYFQNGKNYFVLMDCNYTTISTNKKDMGYDVHQIQFVQKEYCIYINVSLLDNMILAYAHAFRTIRIIFQLKQVIEYKRNNKLNISLLRAKQWHYCYSTRNFKEIEINDIPTEIDKNAFSFVMMQYLFHIEIKYTVRDRDRYEDRVKEIQKEYDENQIRGLFRKFEVENPKLFFTGL